MGNKGGLIRLIIGRPEAVSRGRGWANKMRSFIKGVKQCPRVHVLALLGGCYSGAECRVWLVLEASPVRDLWRPS